MLDIFFDTVDRFGNKKMNDNNNNIYLQIIIKLTTNYYFKCTLDIRQNTKIFF